MCHDVASDAKERNGSGRTWVFAGRIAPGAATREALGNLRFSPARLPLQPRFSPSPSAPPLVWVAAGHPLGTANRPAGGNGWPTASPAQRERAVLVRQDRLLLVFPDSFFRRVRTDPVSEPVPRRGSSREWTWSCLLGEEEASARRGEPRCLPPGEPFTAVAALGEHLTPRCSLWR